MDIYKYLVYPKQELARLRAEYWLKYNVFTVQWLLMIAILFLSWFLWWKFVDKKRLTEILLHGFFVAFFALLLDIMGTELCLWTYPYLLTPLSIIFEVHDFAVLPVVFMFIYQLFPKWKSFLAAHLLVSFIIAFMLEPISVWLNVYKLIEWNYIYSFMIYPVIAACCKAISENINKIAISN